MNDAIYELYRHAREGNLDALKAWGNQHLVSHFQGQWLLNALSYAAFNGHASCVEQVMQYMKYCQENGDICYDLTLYLELSCKNGHVECATLLLPYSTPVLRNSQAFRHGLIYPKIFDLLLPHSQIQSQQETVILPSIMMAVAHDRLDLLEKLTPFWTNKHLPEHQKPLNYAISLRKVEMVAYLLDQVNPLHNQSQPLKQAIKERNVEIAQLIIPRSNVQQALEDFRDEPQVCSWVEQQALQFSTQQENLKTQSRRL